MMKLVLNNFRLYKNKSFLIKDFPLLIVGPNGSGKSSILEALYFLSTTKSFRTNKKKDLINHSEREAYISLVIGKDKMEIILHRQQPSIYRFNNKKIKRFNFISRFFVSLFWWGDFKLVYGPPSERRKILNLFCIQVEPKYLFWLSEYKKIVKSRNLALVKKDRTLVEVWNEKLVPVAVKIWQTRKIVLNLLNKNISPVLSFLYPEENNARICYQGDFLDSGELTKTLLQNIGKEFKVGRTLFGPHLDDLQFHWGGQLLGHYSQGEIKIFLLAFKLGFLEALEGEKIFLVDDAFSGLDSFCQKRLVDFLCQNKVPLVLTHQKKMDKLGGQIIELE